MTTGVNPIDSLLKRFDWFYQTLDAATIPAAGGARKVDGVPHAVAMSEATDALFSELGGVNELLLRQHGKLCIALPPAIKLEHSDTLEGPWTPIPSEDVTVHVYSIGGDGANALLVAALQSAAMVASFPVAKWNAMQAAKPGASHQRWHAGDLIKADELATLDSAMKLLRLAEISFREQPVSQAEQVRRLARAFSETSKLPGTASLTITRTLNERVVTLPESSTFLTLAAEAGKLLADLPEHWRFGVHDCTIREVDPAKRWAGALIDYAGSGIIDVPNWDKDARVECIVEIAHVSEMACQTLLRFSDRPNWGKENYPAAVEFARINAEEILASFANEAKSNERTVFALACEAMRAACAIAKMSRNSDFLSPSQFVYSQTSLEECMARAEKLVKETRVLVTWPITPGVTFSWMGGDSALAVALSFAKAVLSATLFARVNTVGNVGYGPPDLRIAEPDSHPKILAWKATTIQELREHTLQPLPSWQVWEISRDTQKIDSLLRDEYRRSLAADERPRGESVAPAYLDALGLILKVVLVQPEQENECRYLKHSGHRTVRFKKAWGNAQNDRGQEGWGRKLSSAPGDHSSHTRPAIPGELDASRARFRLAG